MVPFLPTAVSWAEILAKYLIGVLGTQMNPVTYWLEKQASDTVQLDAYFIYPH